MRRKHIALLLAGGAGSRLKILAGKRAKPAIPFGGIFRIIDFTLSNISNSGIDIVGVLTQYKPLSLMDHLEDGRPWDLFGRTRKVKILPPKTGEAMSDWYKGTSDAVYQNLGFVDDFSPDQVLIVSGDHIYHLDYRDLISFHQTRRAAVTIGLIRVPVEQTKNFGVAVTDENGRIVEWQEKPAQPRSNLASMGIYLFNRDVLYRGLKIAARNQGNDFARDVIPLLIRDKIVYGYEYKGYWRDVGTIPAYWSANMDMLDPGSGLDIVKWRVRTNLADRGEIGDRPASYFSRTCRVRRSLISRGCKIKGIIENSIVSPGVIVESGARIIDSIIFHDVIIGRNAVISRAIVDKDVRIGDQARVGIAADAIGRAGLRRLDRGITVIGKGTVVRPQPLLTNRLRI